MAEYGGAEQTPSQSDQPGKALPSTSPVALSGFWQSIKNGITFGAIGTLFLGALQYYSSYQEKVAALAKDDMVSATSIFTETLNALSVAQSLQERLIFSFYDTNSDDLVGANAYARDIYKAYEPAYSNLRENNSIFANKVELWLDQPSSASPGTTTNFSAASDPITVSKLGDFGFECENTVPDFGTKRFVLTKEKSNERLNIDWYSSKHHVLTIYYCFNFIHKQVALLRDWASGGDIKASGRRHLINREDHIKALLDRQVVRLNAFMRLATNQIEELRARFRPNGLLCDIPLVGGAVGVLVHKC